MPQTNRPDYHRAAVLKTELKRVGCTQKTVAKEVGITREAVSAYVNGRMKSSKLEQWFVKHTQLSYDELKVS